MAILLPRAGAGTVGTGGRTRKARLPTAGDVPVQEVARDPGVRVPNTAQFQTGLQDVGAAVGEIGERLAAADNRIKTRQESLDRLRIQDEAREKLRDLTEASSRTEDLSAEGAMDALDEFR